MLTELRIASLGVIDDAIVEFGPGFTALTGETGAGKTMVVSSLGLLLGAKGESRLIRHGQSRALVEGRLEADAGLIAAVGDIGGVVEDGEVLLGRVLTANRSRALVGGVQVPAASMADVIGERITIHGQSEQLRLGSSERQREVLDAFAGDELAQILSSYRKHYSAYRRVQAEREALVVAAAERAREMAMLEFALAEIDKVDPVAGEDDTLRAEAKRLQAVDELRTGAHAALTALAGNDDSFSDEPTALALVAQAKKALSRLAGDDADTVAIAQRLAEASYLLADVAGELSSYLAGLDADPSRLEWVAERLAQLQGLTRRYGDSVDEVLAWGCASAERLAELGGSDERISVLGTQLDELDAALTAEAGQLRVLRSQAAMILAERVEAELVALAMPNARLVFEVADADRGPFGADQVHLLFSANPGSALAPLAKVASGGELSRVRLALEVVLASGSEGHTFIFDEVDAGVGGAVALEIGRRLARLAAHCQVIVVTHLAQVAAFADRHYVVHKSDDGQVTTSGVSEAVGEERLAELARMMGGLDGNEAAHAHAMELLEETRRDVS